MTFYTPAEDAIIRKWWGIKSAPAIGKMLGRSGKGIIHRGILIGLGRYGKGALIQFMSPEKSAVIEKWWGRKLCQEIGHEIGMTATQVARRARQMGLKNLGANQNQPTNITQSWGHDWFDGDRNTRAGAAVFRAGLE